MGLPQRLELYRDLEALRGRPLIVYVTSSRQNSSGQMAADSVAELLLQLQALDETTTELDLFIVSHGGDPTVAWRIVSLIRERTKKFSVLVPQAAYSAATLIALGADEIVMHPHGNLGPTDPQIRGPRRVQKDKDTSGDSVPFGSEDLAAFLRFAKEEVGLSDQVQMLSVFGRFCDDVGAVAVGIAARSSQLTVTMGEKLLQLHMPGETNRQKARAISEKLTREFFHHGYPVSRSEAKEIGLKIADRQQDVEALMWQIWADLSEELEVRQPFSPMRLLRAEPACAPLFASVPQIQIPANLPAQVQQQVLNNVLQQIGVVDVPPVAFERIHAVMESRRTNSRYVARGLILGSRQPDQQFKVSTVADFEGWVTVEIPDQAAPGSRSAARKKTGRRRGRS